MKKFARCVLILIFVIIVSGACGYFYEDKTLTTMYTSTTQLYVVPGEENEATVRAVNGGLKDDLSLFLRAMLLFRKRKELQEHQKILHHILRCLHRQTVISLRLPVPIRTRIRQNSMWMRLQRLH